MKVMWITAMGVSDTILQGKNSDINSSGGWIETTFLLLARNIEVDEVVIVSIQPSYDNKAVRGKNMTLYKVRGKAYSVIRQKELFQSLKTIILQENPDIIDIQGIEFDFSILVSRMEEITCPILYTMQGLPSEMVSAYKSTHETIEVMFRRSLRDNITMHGSLEHALLLWLRGKSEKKLLRNIAYVTGRTDWDKTVALRYNSQIEYYHVDRILRPEFYSDEKWTVEGAQKHTVFVPQISSILKGGHILLEIVKGLVPKYPDLVVWIPGEKLNEKSEKNQSGYEKYILKKIKQYSLQKNIVFVGKLNASQIISYLKKSNVFLQVSLIENSSNALAEAQIIGVPCVASNVGGTPTYIAGGDTGILYHIECAEEAAKAVENIFEDEELARKISAGGQAVAQVRHDWDRNSKKLVEAYKEIIGRDKCGL